MSTRPECGSAALPPDLPHGDVEAFAASADGSVLLFAFDVGVFAWRPPTGDVFGVAHARVSVRTLALNASGTHALLVDYDNASLWFVELGETRERRHKRVPCDELLELDYDVSAAVSADGAHVAIATADSARGRLLVLRWAKAKPLAAGDVDARYGLHFAPGDAHIIAGAEQTSDVYDLGARRVASAPTCFRARGGRVWAVDDEAPHIVHTGRWTGAAGRFAWTPEGRRAVDESGTSVDQIVPSPDGAHLAVIVAAGVDERGAIASAVRVLDAEAREVCLLDAPGSDDGLFDAYGGLAWSACGARVYVHAEAPLIEDDDPVATVLAYDARSGAWLGVLGAVQRADDDARIGGAGADPFGIEADDLGDVAFGARRVVEGPVIAFGALGTRLLAQTVDGVYGAGDGGTLYAEALDPFDQGIAVPRYLLGQDTTRSFGMMPAPAPRRSDEAFDPGVDIEDEADAEIAALEASGYGGDEGPAEAETPWWWMLGGGVLAGLLAWWLA